MSPQWRRFNGGVVVGSATALLFAGPLIGSITALGRSEGRTAYLSMARLSSASYDAGSRLMDERNPVPALYRGRDCVVDYSVEANNAAIATNRDKTTVLIDTDVAIHWYRNVQDQTAIDRVEGVALAALPSPVLGALDGCVEASLLAPLCRAYVARIADKAVVASRSALLAEFAKNATHTTQMFCAAGRSYSPTK